MSPPSIHPAQIFADVAENIHKHISPRAAVGFADPPYNQGMEYGGESDDAMPDSEYLQYLGGWVQSLSLAVRPGGLVMFLVPERWADETSVLMKEHVGPRYRRVIWHETFAQYNRHDITRGHRHLFMHRVEGGPEIFNPEAIRIPSARILMGDKRANPDGRIPDDVWKIRRLQGTSKDRVDWHECQLPPEILERIVRGWTNPGDLIAEQFSGSASLARMANRWGRRYIGVDINPEYVDKGTARIREESFGWALAHLANETPQQAWKRRHEI